MRRCFWVAVLVFAAIAWIVVCPIIAGAEGLLTIVLLSLPGVLLGAYGLTAIVGGLVEAVKPEGKQ